MKTEMVVREIIRNPNDKTERLAERIEVPLPLAREFKVQALNIMLGKCVLCETPTATGLCRSCKGKPINRPILRTTRINVLRRLNPEDVILRKHCGKCEREFEVTAAFANRMLSLFNRFDPPKTCKSCHKHRKIVDRNPPLTHKPFQDNKDVAKLRTTLKWGRNGRK